MTQVWDEADYVVPPAENGAFFVTTNVVITPNQTWGECPEVSALVIIQSGKKLNGMLWFKYVKFHLSSESVESNRGMGMKNNLLSFCKCSSIFLMRFFVPIS